MPRIEDYKQARELTKKELSGKDPDVIALCSRAIFHDDENGERCFSISFINREVIISWPELEFSYQDSEDEIPIQQQVLILHYLVGALASRGPVITGVWISFQDVPDGRFYMSAFIKRAKDPFIKTFGQNPKLLVDIASKTYNSSPLEYGDYSIMVKAFPLVPLALVLWEGDEEFPPEANILFDKNISNILSAEDIAWLAGMVVYPLVGRVSKQE